MPSDARTDDSGFVGDDDLGYGRSRTRFTAGEPLRLDETYRLAHLPLVAPDSPATIPRLPGRPYEMGRHPRIFSLVLPVDDGALRRSSAFARLEADLASAPFAGKIAWDLLPRRAHRLHATICGSLSQDEPPRVTRAQRDALAGMPAFDAVLRGLFSGNVNRGRLYLRLYPQRLAGANPLSTIQSVFGCAPSGLYLVGLYNLTADLDPAETAALAEIIDRHWNETWLQIRVRGLDLLGASDDLVLDSEVVETLPLGGRSALLPATLDAALRAQEGLPLEPPRNGCSMSAYDTSNVFAKILRGEVPGQRVYEDADTIAIMDIMPRADGHVLVIPKTACRNILDAPPDALAAVALATQKLARAVKAAFGADGVTIQQFNETAGGQVVFHLHVHVIPRFEGVALRPHTGAMEKPEVLAAHADKIRAALTAA